MEVSVPREMTSDEVKAEASREYARKMIAAMERGEPVDPTIGDAATIPRKNFYALSGAFKRFMAEVNDAVGLVGKRFGDVKVRLDRHSERTSQLERRVKRTERLYLGVWREDRIFHEGDLCTRNSSLWYCQVESTTEKPGQSDHWRLCVKGRDSNMPGPPGPPGPKGEKPAHRWTGTALSFENPDGSFDKAVDLQGPVGRPGMGGGGGVTVITPSSWTPAGW